MVLLGNNVIALDHGKKAAAMEPGNQEYRNWVSQMEYGGNWYESRQSPYGTPNVSSSNWCLKLCILNLVCNMCCGGGGLCCGGVPAGRF